MKTDISSNIWWSRWVIQANISSNICLNHSSTSPNIRGDIRLNHPFDALDIREDIHLNHSSDAPFIRGDIRLNHPPAPSDIREDICLYHSLAYTMNRCLLIVFIHLQWVSAFDIWIRSLNWDIELRIRCFFDLKTPLFTVFIYRFRWNHDIYLPL